MGIGRGRVPHRGDGFSKDFKPRKRFVDLKKLKRLLARDAISIVTPYIIITIVVLVIASNSSSNNKTYIVGLILMWVIVLTFIAGIFDLNKFRKGRDIDISSWEEKEYSEHKEENDN